MFSLCSPQEERAGEKRPLLLNAPLLVPLPTRASRGEGENFWWFCQAASREMTGRTSILEHRIELRDVRCSMFGVRCSVLSCFNLYAGLGANSGVGSARRPGALSAGSAEAARNGSSSSPMRTSRALLKTTTSEPALCRTAAMMGFR